MLTNHQLESEQEQRVTGRWEKTLDVDDQSSTSESVSQMMKYTWLCDDNVFTVLCLQVSLM